MIEAVWKNLCRLHSLFLSVPLSCIIYGLILISKVNSLSVFHTNYIFVDEQKPLLSPAVLHYPPSLSSTTQLQALSDQQGQMKLCKCNAI